MCADNYLRWIRCDYAEAPRAVRRALGRMIPTLMLRDMGDGDLSDSGYCYYTNWRTWSKMSSLNTDFRVHALFEVEFRAVYIWHTVVLHDKE